MIYGRLKVLLTIRKIRTSILIENFSKNCNSKNSKSRKFKFYSREKNLDSVLLSPRVLRVLRLKVSFAFRSGRGVTPRKAIRRGLSSRLNSSGGRGGGGGRVGKKGRMSTRKRRSGQAVDLSAAETSREIGTFARVRNDIFVPR